MRLRRPRRAYWGVAIALFGWACVASGPPGSAGSLPQVQQRYAYPAWFVSGTPSDVTVGYSRGYMSAAESESVAVEDGLNRAWLMEKVRITVGAAFQSGSGDPLASQGERSREEPLGVGVPLFPKGGAATQGMYVVALRPDSVAPSLSTTMVALPATPPAWLTTPPPPDGEWSYAIGVSAAFYREETAWDEAERNARRNLALNAGVRVSGLTAKDSDDDLQVLHFTADVTMEKLSVVARWRDGNSCYVLVRGRIVAVQSR